MGACPETESCRNSEGSYDCVCPVGFSENVAGGCQGKFSCYVLFITSDISVLY